MINRILRNSLISFMILSMSDSFGGGDGAENLILENTKKGLQTTAFTPVQSSIAVDVLIAQNSSNGRNTEEMINDTVRMISEGEDLSEIEKNLNNIIKKTGMSLYDASILVLMNSSAGENIARLKDEELRDEYDSKARRRCRVFNAQFAKNSPLLSPDERREISPDLMEAREGVDAEEVQKKILKILARKKAKVRQEIAEIKRNTKKLNRGMAKIRRKIG